MTKLEKMLKYVSEHNDFYKKRIKEYGIKDPLDITQWPILTRKELQENRYNMFSDGYKAKYYNQQLRRQSSSGSTGMPVNVYWDYKDWYASNMSLWRKRLQWYNIHPSDKYVIFTLSSVNIEKTTWNKPHYIINPNNILSINVSSIHNDNGYDQLVSIINSFEPKWFYIQPLVLEKLTNAYKRSNSKPPRSLKYIESVGEYLRSDLRLRAFEVFDVSIASMYGSEEMNGIAYESPKHEMHILYNNIYLETNDSSEAIITNLNNYAMPLIRYNQGDNIELSQNKVCDRKSLQIKVINGRSLDCVKLPNGSELNPYTLLEAVSITNNSLKDIICDFKFSYVKSTNTLEYSFNLSNELWGSTTCATFEETLKNRIGNIITLKRNHFPTVEISSFSATSFLKKRILEIKEN